MLSTWFDKVIPNNLSWGLIDKHRAKYFLLISMLLLAYSVGSLIIWLYLSGEFTTYTLSFWLLVAVVEWVPLLMLYVDKSLSHTAIVLLVGQFVLINILVCLSGNLTSPMMLNLFYLPLISLLPGSIKLAVFSSIACVLAIVVHFILVGVELPLESYSVLTNDIWFQWNLFACVIISGILAMAYEETVQDMSILLTRERKLSERELLKDDLTGLANQSMLEHYAESLVFRSQRLSQQFSMVYINIQRFSEINKTYGHHSGDMALKLLAKRLSDVVRKTDLVVRLKDDRFLIVLANIKEEENAQNFVEKLTRLLSEDLMINKHELSLTFDIALVNFPKDGSALEELLEQLSGTMKSEPVLEEETYVRA